MALTELLIAELTRNVFISHTRKNKSDTVSLVREKPPGFQSPEKRGIYEFATKHDTGQESSFLHTMQRKSESQVRSLVHHQGIRTAAPDGPTGVRVT